MATLQSLDIRRRSASTETPPQVRQAPVQVAKLIDVSKCIACKACSQICPDFVFQVYRYDDPVEETADDRGGEPR